MKAEALSEFKAKQSEANVDVLGAESDDEDAPEGPLSLFIPLLLLKICVSILILY